MGRMTHCEAGRGCPGEAGAATVAKLPSPTSGRASTARGPGRRRWNSAEWRASRPSNGPLATASAPLARGRLAADALGPASRGAARAREPGSPHEGTTAALSCLLHVVRRC
eukprot:7042630-Prymnesium_polylepis.1